VTAPLGGGLAGGAPVAEGTGEVACAAVVCAAIGAAAAADPDAGMVGAGAGKTGPWAGAGTGICTVGVGEAAAARGRITSVGIPLGDGRTSTAICVPAGSGWLSFTVSVSVPIVSWVRPLAPVPSTVAASVWPSLAASASRLALTSCSAVAGVCACCGGTGCGTRLATLMPGNLPDSR
jgi:hypothetical protein